MSLNSLFSNVYIYIEISGISGFNCNYFYALLLPSVTYPNRKATISMESQYLATSVVIGMMDLEEKPRRGMTEPRATDPLQTAFTITFKCAGRACNKVSTSMLTRVNMNL